MPTGEPPLPVGDEVEIVGKSPWYLAYLRLRRNKIALAFGALFIVIVLLCLAAPLWANYVADTGPNENHLTEKISIGGRSFETCEMGDAFFKKSLSSPNACESCLPPLIVNTPLIGMHPFMSFSDSLCSFRYDSSDAKSAHRCPPAEWPLT